MKLNLPLWAQIGANLLSLVLALVMGWDPVLMLFLFWMENVIIGLWQIPRFLTADGNQPGSQLQRLSGALFKAGFFTVHYGLFTFIHGSLLFELFLKQSLDVQTLEKLVFSTQGIGLALLGMFLSHGIQFFSDLLSGVARNTPIDTVMMEPYSRIVILHLVLLASAFLLTLLPNPVIGVILLSAIKIIMDIHNERKIEKKREAHVS
ncbi:DUF6498-containing protein [Thiolapillus sp.]|uniref:DUF6498-containing protein n=1 Tax=Thiolapillus sp. TaxID=2017437 RepID=UPI0025DAFAB3|nr:DUF6498-containing protein [Thiolapillus sp.]